MFTGRSQPYALAAALEQLGLQFLLQLPHPVADGTGGHMQLVDRQRVAADTHAVARGAAQEFAGFDGTGQPRAALVSRGVRRLQAQGVRPEAQLKLR